MKGTIKVLNDASGHSAVEYDTEAGVVEEAEAILAHAAEMRAVLFDGGTKEKIAGAHQVAAAGEGRSVLEEHEEVLVVPPIAGG